MLATQYDFYFFVVVVPANVYDQVRDDTVYGQEWSKGPCHKIAANESDSEICQSTTLVVA